MIATLGLIPVLTAAPYHATGNLFGKRFKRVRNWGSLFPTMSTVLYPPLTMMIVVFQYVNLDLEKCLIMACSVALNLVYVTLL